MPKQIKGYTDEFGRVCTKCGQYKPREEFNYIGGLHRKYSKSSSCKECHKLYCRSKIGQVIDYVNGICYYPEEKETMKPIPVKYEAPNIDEQIGFISLTKEEEGVIDL